MTLRRFSILLALISLLPGCTRVGLSPQEAGNQTYTSYLMSLYDDPSFMSGAVPTTRWPARLAVAQVGELAPPQKMMDYLREQNRLFAAVDGVPGTLTQVCVQGETPEAAKVRIRQDLSRMEHFARSLGAEYLFLYGGTVDYDSHGSALGVLDLTIVGAFIVPSKSIKGIAKASGALIDVNTGRVVLVATAESQKSTISATFHESDNEQRLADHMRESVMGRLAQQFVQQCGQRASLPAQAGM